MNRDDIVIVAVVIGAFLLGSKLGARACDKPKAAPKVAPTPAPEPSALAPASSLFSDGTTWVDKSGAQKGCGC
jgi:hypothetical protein